MRVFISMPMKDKSYREIALAREEAISDIFMKYPGEDIEIIESQVKTIPRFSEDTFHEDLWCLGASLNFLSRADAAYFVEGWQDARGCRIEHQCCLDYGIPILNDYDSEGK